MIACTLMDIHPENDYTEASTLADVKAKRIARFQSTAEGEVLIDPQKGVAVVAEGHVFNSSAKSSIASEVLQRYMETGVDGLLAMNGQYTVIVYDCRQHKLIALTDTLSTCSPHVYGLEAQCFSFGRKNRPLGKDQTVKKRFDFWSEI